jgi:CheY-like chemotaxis protein
MDGWQVLTQMRKDPDTQGLRVVAFTAHAMVGDEQRVLDAGFDGYLSKPIDFSTFRATVGDLLP